MRTVQKLNSLMFKLRPGDAVLFERGSIFYGQININATGNGSNPLVFGAYGKGKNPVISGSVPVTNWSNYKGDIFNSYVKSQVKELFINDKRMTLARYPNTGFLRIDKPFPNDHNGLFDNDLKQKDGYWDSCNVRIRTENWAYEHSVIQRFKNGNITFSKPTLYSVKQNYGYYLDNKLEELDMEGEWFFDKEVKGKGNLFLQAPNSLNPGALNVQATIYDCGFFSVVELRNVIIRDIEFTNQFVGGIYLAKKKSDISIENCTFSGQNLYGIVIPSGSDNIKINNCRFFDINGYGIYILETNNSSATNCIFQNIGLIPGYGKTGDTFSMSGLLIFGNSINISGNYIDGIGHNGINCIGSGNVVEKNIIKNSMLQLNDGGAIKCYGEQSKDSYWNNNFIFNVPGNNESAGGQNSQIIALGIYLDELANNMEISGNTIVGSGSAGLGTNAGFENSFNNNICYNNEIAATFYQNKIPCKDNIFENNILFSLGNDQITILNQSYQNINIPGIFNNNYYLDPGSYNVFRILYQNVITDYNFEKWKQFVRSDYDSKMVVLNNEKYSKLFMNMSDDSLTILLDSEFDYKDLNMENVYGSIKLQPWSSKILLSDKEVDIYPEINIAGGPLVFNNEESNGTNPLWYNIYCNNLNSNLIISAPEGFLISTDNDEEFRQLISLSPIDGKIDRIIYVKFDPDENRRYYDFITNKSGNLTNNLKITGIQN
jgi:hypothetical protein